MYFGSFRSKTAIQTALFNLREILDYPRLHPAREMRRRALDESVAYLLGLPALPSSFATARQLMLHAIDEVRIKGLVVELGVYKGGTINFIAHHFSDEQSIHGFDTFTGLPTRWTGNAVMFDVGGKTPSVPANVELHVGLFADTLPDWVEAHDQPIALLHMDCDLYESAATGFRYLGPRLREGTVIVFDEYFNYPGWQNHEHKAFQEFVAERRVSYTHLGYAREQLAVRIDQIDTPGF